MLSWPKAEALTAETEELCSVLVCKRGADLGAEVLAIACHELQNLESSSVID
jgi:hypothetical protein